MMFRILLSFLARVVKSAGTTALSPVLEKNVVKTITTGNSTLVLSMSRLIAVAFSAVMLRAFWHAGINGWPDAALGIATVLALPVMNTLQQANPDEVLAVTRLLLEKFKIASGAVDPSKYDDHRPD